MTTRSKADHDKLITIRIFTSVASSNEDIKSLRKITSRKKKKEENKTKNKEINPSS